MKPSDFLTELSTEKLAQYKTAASADATKADKEKDFARGDKRFSGIVKATKKQFANDAKQTKESVGLPYPETYEQTNDKFKSTGQRRTGTLTTEEELNELSCWSGYHRVAGTKAGFPGSCAKNKTNEEGVAEEKCPHCGGVMVSEELMNEKKDACYYKVKSRYKVWPSAYASGALVKCRKSHGSWGNGGKKNESSILEGIERADENLHQWFKEKWVRFGPDGKIRGACARGDDSEGKPKCLPQAKAHNLGKKGRASAAARKRREDPNPERSGKAINVNTKKK